MGAHTKPAPCTDCGRGVTRSITGLCHHCRPLNIQIEHGYVHIPGLGHLTPERALALAHAIADLLTE
jgi:hypothetical protein